MKKFKQKANKAITLQQPLAWLIFNEGKNVQSISHDTKHRGVLWIHAGRNEDLLKNHCDRIEFAYDCTIPEIDREQMMLGYIIGHVDLVNVVSNSGSKWAENNRFHLILKNPRLLQTPFPIKGKPRLWAIPEEYQSRLTIPAY